jgi:hypothetical protein
MKKDTPAILAKVERPHKQHLPQIHVFTGGVVSWTRGWLIACGGGAK